MAFTIRRIYDDYLPVNRRAIDQIIAITRSQIDDMTEESLESMRRLFREPFYRKMRYMFFIAGKGNGGIEGFAQMSFAPDLKFCFIDILAMKQKKKGGGVGSALYQRVREEARDLGAVGIYGECMTDDKGDYPDKEVLRQNRSRLRFYEQYGMRPVINTHYEEHTRRHYSNPYFIIFDDLDSGVRPGLDYTRKVFRAILERKYTSPCSVQDITQLIKSVRDDPVKLRGFRYLKKEYPRSIKAIPDDKKIVLVCNDGHEIHHIRERGYVESPVRIVTILRELEKTPLFIRVTTKKYSVRHIKNVHDSDFVEYFKRVTLALQPGRSLYPDVFPIRKTVRPPKKLISRAGYYCTDVYSPINRNSYIASRGAVNCALTGADAILSGARIAYALVRPPGHHADRNSFGGFCYFNSTAIAGHYLSGYGRVAILDLDYHHGNGQQEIFYSRQDVLTLSVHGDPNFEYPHFSGFRDEAGRGDGHGFNINYPLSENVEGPLYHKILKKALAKIRQFAPDFLIIALGLDTSKGDPTGTWRLGSSDFRVSGAMAGSLSLPTLVVQEGGYNNRVLGINARNFFTGLWEGYFSIKLQG